MLHGMGECFQNATTEKGLKQRGSVESEDVPENVKIVSKEIPTLLSIEVTKPVIHFIL